MQCTSTPSNIIHNCADLVYLFDRCFKNDYHTILMGGASEPLYQPAVTNDSYHIIYFSYDYFSSALHEIAHWCIAGDMRRRQVDYGYWYEPDGRNAEQQQAFELAEIKPQAIERAFSEACLKSFRVSVDNLNGQQDINESQQVAHEKRFSKAVKSQYEYYESYGFPERAAQFLGALSEFYQLPLNPKKCSNNDLNASIQVNNE